MLAEQFIDGPEFTAAMLGDEALPLIRIEAPQGNYDYQNKYFTDDTKYHCPCGLPGAKEEELKALALRAFRAVGCSGWGRVDLMLDAKKKPWLLEVNTIPGMTESQPGADGGARAGHLVRGPGGADPGDGACGISRRS